ncbi:unnamed protein product [Prorocentrum cordatum]|uniref:Uncharacterized protein n=1 Tax=Prorocentrum cordatum TaxID=2364126 RepID=A0ABN9UP65_9DINO|nr:unnamed protein product [Polarella glacialis]
MGAVHGVYAKYVGLSVGSLGTFLCLKPEEVAHAELPLLCVLVSLLYASCLNAVIAALFRLESCMGILGKDESTGAVPAWSYVLFAPFHLPTFLYTAASRQRDAVTGVSVADEVAAGWWLGGRYASELRRQWSGIIDRATSRSGVPAARGPARTCSCAAGTACRPRRSSWRRPPRSP